MTSLRRAACAALAATLCLFSTTPTFAECASPTVEQFGYNTRPIAPGVRPLLTILVDFTDAPINPARGPDYYQRLFFGANTRGGGSASLNAMYYAASNGAVSFTNAGVVSVAYPGPGDPLPADFSAQITMLAAAAMRASGGRTFESFDRNGDHRIDNSELMIVRVSNSPVYRDVGATGWHDGATTPGDPVLDSLAAFFGLPTRYRFTGELSGVDEEMDLNGIAHEVLHAFGNDDHIYGPGFSLNAFGSFFAGSYSAAAPPGALALDPYTRMRSGWLRPRLMRLNAPGTARLRHYGDSAHNDTLLFYDEARCDEFFLAEFRNPSRPLAAVDRGAGGVAGSAGVILWYVKAAADFSPYQFNWPPPIRGPFVLSAAGDHMVANYMVGPRGPALYSNLIWDTPEFSPSWGDGTPTNVGFEAFFTSNSDAADLTWRRTGGRFIARIDAINGAVRPTLPVAAGTDIVLTGMFPARPAGIGGQLINLSGRTDLAVISYASDRIVLRARAPTPAGPYQVHLVAAAPREIVMRGNFQLSFR